MTEFLSTAPLWACLLICFAVVVLLLGGGALHVTRSKGASVRVTWYGLRRVAPTGLGKTATRVTAADPNKEERPTALSPPAE